MADEPVRAQLAEQMVLPADQRFGGDDASTEQVDLRLVHEMEFAVVGRAAQMGFHPQPVRLGLRQRGRERLPCVARAALAVVHRGVGVLDQRLRAFAVAGRAGDADAGGDREFLIVEAETVHQRLQDRACDPLRALRVVGEIADHQEFVAAKTATSPSVPTALAMRCAAEQFVAGRVAEHVVDDLETVEIDVRRCNRSVHRILHPYFEFDQDRIVAAR